jgi:signal transduction histidine kinase
MHVVFATTRKMLAELISRIGVTSMRAPVPSEPAAERRITDTPLQGFVESEQLRLLFAKGASPHVTSIVNASLYVTVVWSKVPHSRLVGWLGLILVVAGSRILVARQYHRHPGGPDDVKRWAHINTVGAALHGLVWGSAAFLVCPMQWLPGQMLLALMSGGMAAGAATLSASHLASCLAFVVPDMLLLPMRLLAQPDWLHRVMGIVLLMFGGFMVTLARAGNRSSTEAIELRYRLAALSQVAARRADELEQFAGRVAHDILGPLTSAKIALTYAAERTNDAAVMGMLARGHRGVARVSMIVDGLLRFARAGAQPEPGIVTPVRPVLEGIMAELEPLAAQAETRLVLEPLEECAVACNAGVLSSLVENLVRNAIKYIGDGPDKRVVVRVCGSGASDRFVHFDVEDTGPGIEPSRLDGLFDPHVRGLDTSLPGIGLGLATVRRISEAHGGHAGVTSVVGVGSTFWFELPRAAPGPDERRRSPETAERALAEAHLERAPGP